MRKLIILSLMFFLQTGLRAQDEMSNRISPEWTVSSHKDQLHLTLIIDSVQIGNKTRSLTFKRAFDINFESDYFQVTDDIYIKIFISRNQEYGKKFYSWKWDYLRKKGDHYSSLGIGYYAPMDFDQPMSSIGSYGQGIGNVGEPDYLMFYYRYKLE